MPDRGDLQFLIAHRQRVIRCPDSPDAPIAHSKTISRRRAAVLATKHTRFCEGVDPESPTHRTGLLGPGPDDVELLNRDVPPDHPVPIASFPPLAQQTRNLAGAAVRFVASGGERTTTEERTRRLSICEVCDFFKDRRCLKCGCRLNLKVSMSAEHCPIDKW